MRHDYPVFTSARLHTPAQVNFMTSFNSASFPDSLALAKEGAMTIGGIDEVQKLHIRTVPLGEQPRRLAHQEASRTFVVLTSPASVTAGLRTPSPCPGHLRCADRVRQCGPTPTCCSYGRCFPLFSWSYDNACGSW